MYAMTIIQLDLKFVFSVLFYYCSNLNFIYIKAVTYVLCYIKITLHYSIYFFTEAVNNHCFISD